MQEANAQAAGGKTVDEVASELLKKMIAAKR
jgi:hypothetical protein